jgi:hypothetical protein
MISKLHVCASSDPNCISLQGYEKRVRVTIQVDKGAIANVPCVGITPTREQSLAFVRHNIDAIRAIAERKLENGEGQPEDYDGKPGLSVLLHDSAFADYLSLPGSRLSLAAFGPHAQARGLGGTAVRDTHAS